MKINELKSVLLSHATLPVVVALPDGGRVPAHFHVTEVGHIAKKFVDCGGTFRTDETCVLQTWVGSPRDDGHRLTAGRLAKILGLAKPILPETDLPVEVEYEAEVISQFPLMNAKVDGSTLVLQLDHKHTDCLAREKCGIEAKESEATAGCGCGTGCC
jgi:hypothetical protein